MLIHDIFMREILRIWVNVAASILDGNLTSLNKHEFWSSAEEREIELSGAARFHR